MFKKNSLIFSLLIVVTSFCNGQKLIPFDQKSIAYMGRIESVDPKTLVTVGLIQVSVPTTVNTYSGFRPARQARFLDFMSIHFYPYAKGAFEYSSNEEKAMNRATWIPSLPQDVNYQKTNLTVSEKRDEYSGEVTISTDNWAQVVTFDADVDFEDNYFEMLPGETRTIKWKSRVHPFSKEIKVSCWNQ
jgi:hypothetical protein